MHGCDQSIVPAMHAMYPAGGIIGSVGVIRGAGGKWVESLGMCVWGELGNPSEGFRVEEKDSSLWGGTVKAEGIGLRSVDYRMVESSWEGDLKGIV